MNKPQPILTYTFTFLILVEIFRIIGIIKINNEEMLSYTFIFYGLSSVYLSLGRDKKFRVFLGSAVFLIGIIFFVLNNFDIINFYKLIFPAFLLIVGISCMMLYIDNSSDKAILYISLIFILAGLVYSMSFGSMKPNVFIYSLYEIILKYWIIAVIALIIFLAINTDKKDNI